MLARVLSATLSSVVVPRGTKEDVNGIEAFPMTVEFNCGRGDTIIVILSCNLPNAFRSSRRYD
jgi:hypothetical protein